MSRGRTRARSMVRCRCGHRRLKRPRAGALGKLVMVMGAKCRDGGRNIIIRWAGHRRCIRRFRVRGCSIGRGAGGRISRRRGQGWMRLWRRRRQSRFLKVRSILLMVSYLLHLISRSFFPSLVFQPYNYRLTATKSNPIHPLSSHDQQNSQTQAHTPSTPTSASPSSATPPQPTTSASTSPKSNSKTSNGPSRPTTSRNSRPNRPCHSCGSRTPGSRGTSTCIRRMLLA